MPLVTVSQVRRVRASDYDSAIRQATTDVQVGEITRRITHDLRNWADARCDFEIILRLCLQLAKFFF